MDSSDELVRSADPSALLAVDGTIGSVNTAMAATLGRPAEQCVGRNFLDLLSEPQRAPARDLLSHAATTETVAMRELQFPGPGRASVVSLVEARQARDPEGGEHLVRIRLLDPGNDRGGLLVPYRLAASSAGLGLCMYTPQECRLEWLGDASALSPLFPEASVSLLWVVRRVHPDDRKALRRLVQAASPRSPWSRLRFLTEGDDWHVLCCQAYRIQLGYGGPERIFALIRDDTELEAHWQEVSAALSAEQQRADQITAFSAALITATTEQELRQIVLARLAATFGGIGTLLAFVDEGRLRVFSDARIPPQVADAVHHLSLGSPNALPYAIRTGEPQFIRDPKGYISSWPPGAGFPGLAQLGSDCAVSITPLSEAGSEPLGAWMVIYGSGHRPSQDEQVLLNTLADLAGQALRRIRLHQARVELATAVQGCMLPTLPEQLPGLEVAARYLPSRDGLDIGGDWYDAFVMTDGAVVLEIGDAQGHDVVAAAAMGQVRASIRAIAGHEPDPATVLTRTNELLVAMDTTRFASCTMLYVDPWDGQVIGASAGHVPVLCVYKDGSHTIHELPGGPVLGIVPGTEYSEETFNLDGDSALVMVTDGVVEGPGLTLEAGLERAGTLAGAALQEGLNAEATADRILDAAVAVDHLDDIAVLVIRRLAT
ncbi:SpoIIE family protein phosphatase [Streptomyces sp. NPDC091215]|uniref:SpoIIE family protein phosphatase n=1 Tax=Streptomyces sp. NPDC091215 TaxID=3155192 RepID=UPI00343AB1A1